MSKAASLMGRKSAEKRMKEGGREVYVKMGKKLAKQRGPDYFKELNRKSQEAKRLKREATKDVCQTSQ